MSWTKTSLWLFGVVVLGTVTACAVPSGKPDQMTIEQARKVLAAAEASGRPTATDGGGNATSAKQEVAKATPAVVRKHAFFVKKVGGGMSPADLATNLDPAKSAGIFHKGVTEATYRAHLSKLGVNLGSHAELAAYLQSGHMEVISCTDELAAKVTMASVDDNGVIHTTLSRKCYQGEKWLVLSSNEIPVISLDCGNLIYQKKQPAQPASRPTADCQGDCKNKKT